MEKCGARAKKIGERPVCPNSNAFHDATLHPPGKRKCSYACEDPDTVVRDSHPSKIAKGGAASFVVMRESNSSHVWASPRLASTIFWGLVRLRVDIESGAGPYACRLIPWITTTETPQSWEYKGGPAPSPVLMA